MFSNMILFTSIILATFGCQTALDSKSADWKIVEGMSMKKIVQAAISGSEKTYGKAQAYINRRGKKLEAADLAKDELLSNLDSMKPAELIHAARLIKHNGKNLDRKLFAKMVFSDIKLARDLSWRLAQNFANKTTANIIDDALSLILAEGDEELHFTSAMANAVAVNRLKSGFRLIHRGLMQTGDDAFAKALITLDPKRASSELLDYLALAPLEDLRQLNQKSVNLLTCYVIFKQLQAVHPPVNHPKYEHLFLYAVSRNQSLAEMARSVLEDGFVLDRSRLAFILARLPGWVQVSYVDGVRRQLNPNVRGFLAELKKLTVQDDVLEELKNIRL